MQKQLNAVPYGPSLADVEKQIAAHNIQHQAIEAYSSQLSPSTTASQVREQETSTPAVCRAGAFIDLLFLYPQEQYAALKDKYAKLFVS